MTFFEYEVALDATGFSYQRVSDYGFVSIRSTRDLGDGLFPSDHIKEIAILNLISQVEDDFKYYKNLSKTNKIVPCLYLAGARMGCTFFDKLIKDRLAIARNSGILADKLSNALVKLKAHAYERNSAEYKIKYGKYL